MIRSRPLPRYVPGGGRDVHCLGIGCTDRPIRPPTTKPQPPRRNIDPPRPIIYRPAAQDRMTPNVGGYVTVTKNGVTRRCCPSCGPADPCNGWY